MLFRQRQDLTLGDILAFLYDINSTAFRSLGGWFTHGRFCNCQVNPTILGLEGMGKRVAILQSNYLPWKGYFDLIGMVDEFILYDDVQYTKNDWRNRNRIKTRNGLRWITIPVQYHYPQKIKDTLVSDPDWNRRHWKSISQEYSRAKYFRDYKDAFEDLYLKGDEKYLSLINYRFIAAVCDMLGIRTKLSWSMDYRLVEGKTERLVDLCRQAGASEYLSGPSAKGYIEEACFLSGGIALRYMDYSGYPEYRQLHGDFVHEVSIIDLIFNEGPGAASFLKSFGGARTAGTGERGEA